jgi:alpha-glucoside transport system substrate-binding protein
MRYLVTSEAQSIWVRRGGALSVNTAVPDYPDDISARAARVLATADTFRFDGSDLMPEAMNQAFWGAILDFTRDQTQLPTILEHLDVVRASAYGGP